MPSRAWVVTCFIVWKSNVTTYVSMPSRAWVVTSLSMLESLTIGGFNALTGLSCYVILTLEGVKWVRTFQCPHGLELLHILRISIFGLTCVSMPSRAWVVTARMSNILNFLWYFLCIPAIYKCILAYLSIFFNQLSEFLRCESPSTFLGTCLSHHSFIILLITSTSALLTGLYLISTGRLCYKIIWHSLSVNALSGLYLISTVPLQKPRFYAVSRACFCRHLSEYSDNSCFSCMLTFWTYLMRCTYPWHWIKYSTKYNRCHPIFSLSW